MSDWHKTRLQQVAWAFIVADEALRKSMLREETLRAHIKRLLYVMGPKQPQRIEVIGQYSLEIWSLPMR